MTDPDVSRSQKVNTTQDEECSKRECGQKNGTHLKNGIKIEL